MLVSAVAWCFSILSSLPKVNTISPKHIAPMPAGAVDMVLPARTLDMTEYFCSTTVLLLLSGPSLCLVFAL